MIALEVRKTHKYVGTYQHLDEWEELGHYDIEAKNHVELPDDDGTAPAETTLFVKVTLNEGVKFQSNKIKVALEDSNTSNGCAHEYDCCGCRSYGAEAAYIGGDIWKVIVGSSCNY